MEKVPFHVLSNKHMCTERQSDRGGARQVVVELDKWLVETQGSLLVLSVPSFSRII